MKQAFTAVVLLALLTAMPAVAADTVPFHATINTKPVPVGECGPACIVLDIPGSGTASHMGSIDAPGASTINFATLVQTGSFTLIAANGDTITFTFSGTFVPGPKLTDPVTFEGTWTVTEGTGRFAGGSGSGTYYGSAVIPNGILYLDGRISTVGSNKK